MFLLCSCSTNTELSPLHLFFIFDLLQQDSDGLSSDDSDDYSGMSDGFSSDDEDVVLAPGERRKSTFGRMREAAEATTTPSKKRGQRRSTRQKWRPLKHWEVSVLRLFRRFCNVSVISCLKKKKTDFFFLEFRCVF